MALDVCCGTQATRNGDEEKHRSCALGPYPVKFPLIQSSAQSYSANAGYSFWTNSTYRAPLVFSGLSCLVGNLVLCLSYDTKLLPLLYLARLVTGVGENNNIYTLAPANMYSRIFVLKRNHVVCDTKLVPPLHLVCLVTGMGENTAPASLTLVEYSY